MGPGSNRKRGNLGPFAMAPNRHESKAMRRVRKRLEARIASFEDAKSKGSAKGDKIVDSLNKPGSNR